MIVIGIHSSVGSSVWTLRDFMPEIIFIITISSSVIVIIHFIIIIISSSSNSISTSTVIMTGTLSPFL